MFMADVYLWRFGCMLCLPASCLFHLVVVKIGECVFVSVSTVPHLVVPWTENSCVQLVRMRPDEGLDDIWLSTCQSYSWWWWWFYDVHNRIDRLVTPQDRHFMTVFDRHCGRLCLWIIYCHDASCEATWRIRLLSLLHGCGWCISCGLLLDHAKISYVVSFFALHP